MSLPGSYWEEWKEGKKRDCTVTVWFFLFHFCCNGEAAEQRCFSSVGRWGSRLLFHSMIQPSVQSDTHTATRVCASRVGALKGNTFYSWCTCSFCIVNQSVRTTKHGVMCLLNWQFHKEKLSYSIISVTSSHTPYTVNAVNCLWRPLSSDCPLWTKFFWRGFFEWALTANGGIALHRKDKTWASASNHDLIIYLCKLNSE